jgi:hypothetical protein
MDRDTELESWRKLAMSLGDTIGKAEITMPTCKFCGFTDVVKNSSRKGNWPGEFGQSGRKENASKE